jgi:hypothetical protein
MTDLVLEQLRRLAGTLTALHGQVREAVAGEVGRAVADAVAEVLTTTLGGRLAPMPTYGGRPASYGRSTWDDPDDGWDDGYAGSGGSGSPRTRVPAGPGGADVSGAALAVAVAAGRWWLGCRGSAWQAAGVAVAAAAALAGGGPVARTVLGVLWAAHRLRAATDALGDGARAIGRE